MLGWHWFYFFWMWAGQEILIKSSIYIGKLRKIYLMILSSECWEGTIERNKQYMFFSNMNEIVACVYSLKKNQLSQFGNFGRSSSLQMKQFVVISRNGDWQREIFLYPCSLFCYLKIVHIIAAVFKLSNTRKKQNPKSQNFWWKLLCGYSPIKEWQKNKQKKTCE